MSAHAEEIRSPRALFVHDSLAENGAVRVTLDVAYRFLRMGVPCEVFVVQPVRHGREAELPTGVTPIRGVPRRRRLRTSAPAAVVRLLRACRRADVVVSASEIGLGLLSGFVAARLVRRPFAVIVHAPLDLALEHWVPPALHGPTRQAHRRADAAVYVSEALAADARASGMDAGRVHVVPNAVDFERIRRLAAAEPTTPAARPTVVGFGRLSPQKAFDLLVRAHAELRGRGVDHDLEIIGEGPDRDVLVRLAAELGVADSCSLPGFVDNPYGRIASAAALVLPSRYEGNPLVLLEALSLDVPVLASRAAGHSLLADGQLFENESVAALTDALERHLANPEPLREAARAGGELVRSRSLDEVARDYLRVLEKTSRHTRAPTRVDPVYE